MKKKKLIIALLFLFPVLIYGQAQPGYLVPPRVFLPSPTAASLGKYGNLPVNLTNGIPQINIPLYVLADGDIKIPISLDYYGSAIRVTDKAGWVGTNWTLNAGGAITRVVRGIADDEGNGYFNLYSSWDILNPTPTTYLNQGALTDSQNLAYLNIFGQNFDTEPDMFYYNFLGHQGKFYYDINQNIQLVPYDDIKIEVSGAMGQFKVTTNDGVVYIFGGAGATERSTVSNDDNPYAENLYSANTTWYLKSMTLPSGQTATFNYQPNPFNTIITDNLSSESDYYYTGPVPRDPIWSGNIYPVVANTTTLVYNQILQSIVTDNATINFNHDATEREDLPADYALSQISVILNSSNTTVKQFNFNHSYYLSPFNFCPLKQTPTAEVYEQKRLILNSVTESYPGNPSLPKTYSFTYDSGDLPPTCSCAQDHYGYYNGALTNPNLLPAVAVMDPTALSANRDPNPATINNHLLTKITYPTGGYSSLIFESPTDATALGSSRVKEIDDYEFNGTLLKKKVYQYSNAYTQWTASNSDYSQHINVERPENVFSDPDELPYTIWHHSDYQMRTSNVYYDVSNFDNPRVNYGTVTVLEDNAGVNGKTVYNYSQAYDDNHNGFPYAPATSYSWRKGLLLDQAEYDASGNIKHEITNTYNFVPKSSMIAFKLFISDYHTMESTAYDPHTVWINNIITYRYYNLISEWVQQTSHKESIFVNGSTTPSLSTTENYFYQSPNNTALTRKETSRSDGRTTVNYYTYPTDYATGTPWIDNLNTSFIKAIPVETTEAIKDTSGNVSITGGLITTYKPGGLGLKDVEYSLSLTAPVVQSNYKFSNQAIGILPQPTAPGVFAYDARFEPRFSYNWIAKTTTTKALLNQFNKTNGEITAVLWGYNQSYPVAQATNSPVNDIFFDSFEEGDGNTNYNNAKTGHYGYIGNYSHTLSGLDNGAYLLSYWLKTGAVWALQTNNINISNSTTTPGNGSYTIAVSGQIDDIRFYPASAMMTTYTYDPVVGETSSTDAKGLITYYEYDSFQRLMNIRDKDQNIIKSFCYNYAGQATNCFINTSSYYNISSHSGTYTKLTGCGAGYAGTQVTYTVPAQSYFSNISTQDAENQAQNDVNINGQNYANLNGACVLGTAFTVNNATSSKMTITFTGATTYQYSVNPSTNTTFQVPTGTYASMSVGVNSGPTYTFTLGTRTPVTYSIAGWSSVNISGGSSDLTLTIH